MMVRVFAVIILTSALFGLFLFGMRAWIDSL